MEKNLFYKIPNIKRARDFYIYTQDGNRLLDLYRENGNALIGHKYGKFTHYFKNLLSQGVLTSYPSIYKNRLMKSIKKIFPEYSYFYFFKNMDCAKLRLKIDKIFDPLFDFKDESKIFFHRFFCNNFESKIIVPIFPLLGLEITIICSKENLNIEDDIISPIILGATTRAIYDFKKFYSAPLTYRSIEFPAPFSQNGPYVLFNLSYENYEKLFTTMLEKNILISPNQKTPTILPVEKKVKR